MVGNLVGVETGNLKYELTATVEPTCTTPGKRVYTCVTEGVHKGETYEETIRCAGPPLCEGRLHLLRRTREQRRLLRCHPDRYRRRGLRDLHCRWPVCYWQYLPRLPSFPAAWATWKELKAQGVNTLVFRTQLRETSLEHR